MTSRTGTLLMATCLFFASPPLKAQGQGSEHAAVIVPGSSVEHAGDQGVRAHTNHLIRAPQSPEKGKPGGGGSPTGETPASIRPVYGLPSTGGSGIIAIVDAFDYPTAAYDFSTFSTQFGLPNASGQFRVVYASGSQPRGNCGWNQEAALDIEWAHAMAPNALIVLVEADSNTFADLFNAVDVATQIVSASGKGEVSMSWGGSEFSSEGTNDGYFNHSNVVYFGASGDTGGKNIYPSVSPNVVSAGGTTIHRDKNHNFTGETAWSASGGGPSAYEPRPSYQDSISGLVGNFRGAPDFSFDADPSSGVSVYDSTPCQGRSGWLVFGGTSVSAPSLAGIVNLAGHFSSSSTGELGLIYLNLGKSADFRDITSGTAGSFSAVSGWDFVTGVGSNQGTSGK